MPAEGLRQRFFTSVMVMVPLLAVLFLAPRIYGVFLLALMVLAGAWEWAGFFGTVRPQSRIAYMTLIGAAMLAAWFPGAAITQAILWVAIGWWIIAFVWLLRFPTAVPGWLILIGGLLILVPGWTALARLHTGAGPAWLIFFFLVIAAADTGAYFTGRAIGRTRLAPNVSPGKTWEGAAGGLVAVAVIAGAGAIWFARPPVFLLSLCLAVALASIVGDLTISMFKRNAGLKDSGRFLPGHGGVMDRIDSMSAGAPLFVIGLGWADHIT